MMAVPRLFPTKERLFRSGAACAKNTAVPRLPLVNRSRILSFILVHECFSTSHGGLIVRLKPNLL
jgi:hypothetical protein